MTAGWTPGAYSSDDAQLMLHSGRKRRPFECTRGQLANILAAYEAAGREEMTMDQIKEAADAGARGFASGVPAVAGRSAGAGSGLSLSQDRGRGDSGDDRQRGNKRPHSPIGASGYSRWSVCAGSVRLSRGLPSRDSRYSAEGTAAHWVMEQCLRLGTDAWEYAGVQVPTAAAKTALPENFADLPDDIKARLTDKLVNPPAYTTEVDDEMIEGAQLFVDTVRGDLPGDDDCLVWIEHGFSLEQLGRPDAYGTADCAVYNERTGLLRVYDFKYGAGIVVEAEGNGQVRYYATGCVLDISANIGAQVAEVETVIVQPRCEHNDGYVRRERLTVDELNAWVENDLLPALARTDEPDAQLVEGPHCRFCPAKQNASCPRLQEIHQQLVETAPATVDAAQTAARVLEDWELAERLAKAGPVKMFIQALQDEATERMRKGSVVPGWKLVPKKSNRVLKTGGEEEARKLWGDQAYSKPVLLGIPSLEKMEGGKEWANRWAFKPDTGLTLAPDTDKREGVKMRTPKEVFAAQIQGGK